MAAPSCSECGGMRWVRYFSETMDGNFEEAFRLCSCNYEPQARSERSSEGSERSKSIAGELASPLDRSIQEP